MRTRRCRGGHSKWELVEKRRPAECEHEQKARRGRVQGREVEKASAHAKHSHRKSAELKPSVIEPKSKRKIAGEESYDERGDK